MRRLLPLALLLTVPVAAQEPVPDTTAPWRYFPLEVGNVWEYECHTDFCGGFERWSLVGDTVIGDRHYVVRRTERFTPGGQPTGPVSRDALRFDSETSRIFRHASGTESAETCDLSAAFGSRIDCIEFLDDPDGSPAETRVYGWYGGTVLVGGDVVSVEGWKQYATSYDYPIKTFAAPLGLLGTSEPGEWVRLRYARVGDVEYGTPVVSAEPPAGPVPALRLEARPNPAAGPATLALTLPAAGPVEVVVFDVTGRRVAVVRAGWLPAGAHRLPLDTAGLPAGAYVVRATAGRWSATARLTLR